MIHTMIHTIFVFSLTLPIYSVMILQHFLFIGMFIFVSHPIYYAHQKRLLLANTQVVWQEVLCINKAMFTKLLVVCTNDRKIDVSW